MRITLSYQTEKRYPVPSVYQNMDKWAHLKKQTITKKGTGSTFK